MIAEHAEVTLARRPPVSSLFKALAFLLLLFLALFGMYAMVASDRELLNPAAGSVFWFRWASSFSWGCLHYGCSSC